MTNGLEKAKKLSRQQTELLRVFVAGRPLNPPAIGRLLGKPVSAVSAVRNSLLNLGLIDQWRHWNDMPALTPLGLTTLQQIEHQK